MDKTQKKWHMDIEGMPHFDIAMERVEAWYEQEIIDRVPVRFFTHNAQFNVDSGVERTSEEQRTLWFDVEYQVEKYLKSIAGQRFHGETFPIFSPNLGPDVYAAFYGAELEFGDVTSWSHPFVKEWNDVEKLHFSKDNVYFKKIEELTSHALERCEGKFLVGYTDFHPGEDCAMAWRGSTQMCMDVYDYPEQLQALIEFAFRDFQAIFDHFDDMIKAGGQPSSTWIGIPSFGKMHVPSCDWSAMISPKFFRKFSFPYLSEEVIPMDRSIYHVDGPGVARHLDQILTVPKVHAIQWVQGLGKLAPIMQWVPLIQQVQDAGKAIIVDLKPAELDEFMDTVRPEGIYLWVPADTEEEQLSILKKVETWV